MMKKIIYSLSLLIIGISSCKKTYTCECKNSNGTYPAGEKEGTRNQVKKYCEGLSTSNTQCNIKQ